MFLKVLNSLLLIFVLIEALKVSYKKLVLNNYTSAEAQNILFLKRLTKRPLQDQDFFSDHGLDYSKEYSDSESHLSFLNFFVIQ
jgi:hypothetical protein